MGFSNAVQMLATYDSNLGKFRTPFSGGTFNGVDIHDTTSAYQVGGNEVKSINAFTLLPGSAGDSSVITVNSAYIAGNFRTIDGVAMNSVAFIGNDGKAAALGADADKINVGVRQTKSLVTTPSALGDPSKENEWYQYVAGEVTAMKVLNNNG
jgi:hypothetical protein